MLIAQAIAAVIRRELEPAVTSFKQNLHIILAAIRSAYHWALTALLLFKRNVAHAGALDVDILDGMLND